MILILPTLKCDVAEASALTTPGEFQNNQKAKYDFPKGI